MGADKALIEFRGQPLIAHMLEILREAGLSVSIAGARSEIRAKLSDFAPVVIDTDSEQGPLAGICSALAACTETWLVFVPIDLPLLPSDLIKILVEHAQVACSPITLVSLRGFRQTFPCVLNRVVAPILTRELKAGRSGCFSAFQRAAADLSQPPSAIPAEFLVQTGQVKHPAGLPAERWLFNLNSPADLERARTFRPALIARTDRIA